MKIYTDGSCRANGVGGIGVVWVVDDKIVQKYSKRFEGTTNNQMELTAILAALVSIKGTIDELEIVTDSQYCLGVLTNPTWKPKKNIELISVVKKRINKTQELVRTPIVWTHTRGHSDNEFNNLCDKLATDASSI